MLKAIAFDFDGVILESTAIKTQAFRQLFQDYPEQLEAIVQLHLEKAGISRFEKFRIIYQDYLQQPLEEETLANLGVRFSQQVYEAVLACPFVAGAEEFLRSRAPDYPLYIASGTPEAELQAIVHQRHLKGFFQGVYGSPASKQAILQRILHEQQLQPSELLMIGDAIADYQGAKATAVPFVGRVEAGKPNPFPSQGAIALIADLWDLDQQWPSLLMRCFT
ncbi:HAD family hydrolase [Neosynechococcus sphagnicola]|uniref:HAD family hydrolase n=1 Tax=Neosynechococcus sphagnicola TaxID=1501145 RepID=UPI00069168AA|nr:HAD-IA family hydrolase [Neosynechococcus sphagnicola]